MSALTVVTGADGRFFRTLYQFLESARRHRVDRDHAIVAFDLGLEQAQREWLRRRFVRVTWRAFPFERHPAFVGASRFAIEATPPRYLLGHYAWKAAIVDDVLSERGGVVLWLDAATLIRGALDPVVEAAARDGTYVPYSGVGTLAEFVHPTTRSVLGLDDSLLGRRCRGSGLCAFDAAHPIARRLVAAWKRHSLDEGCIAPQGSGHHNHRYDQAILSVLLYQAEAADGLRLTGDEQNINSAHPVTFCLVRSKVRNGVPLLLDPLLARYFAARAAVDVAVHRLVAGALRVWQGKFAARLTK